MNAFEILMLSLLAVFLSIVVLTGAYAMYKGLEMWQNYVLPKCESHHRCPKCGLGVSYHAYACYHCFTKLRWV